MRRIVLFLLMILSAPISIAELAPWAENPRVWSYAGKPVLLAGASDDDNLFQWPHEQLVSHLDHIKRAGGNLVRNTMSDRRDRGFEAYPYLETKPGRYDLDRWNPEYWQRFERFLEETHRRGITVQIELWDRFDFSDHGKVKHWQSHPYNPANNANYSAWRSRLGTHYPDHPGKNRQPFFFTTPEQHNNRVLLHYQQRYIDKVLSYSLKYDHVLYCIDNETKAGEAWSRYWALYIKQQARAAGSRIHVTEMLDERSMDRSIHGRTIDHPEMYDFIEVSQNNHNDGQIHWQNLLRVRGYLDSTPRPMNAIKIYGAAGSKYGNQQQAIQRFWRNVLAGTSALRFHRPESGLGLNVAAINTLRTLRLIEQEVDLVDLRPLNIEATVGEAYVARIGTSHLVFLPTGAAKLSLPLTKPIRIDWLSVDNGTWHRRTSLVNATDLLLNPPGQGNWIALIH